jgi:hypothetical protein
MQERVGNYFLLIYDHCIVYLYAWEHYVRTFSEVSDRNAGMLAKKFMHV